jgi:hypothetical protein
MLTAKYSITVLPRDINIASYRFAVSNGQKKVAEIHHDCRGEDFYVVLFDERAISTDRILTGGGPTPIVLTDEGVAIIDRLCSLP